MTRPRHGVLPEPAIRTVALVWGLAEATLFFVIPDVLLSLVAVRRRRLALEACLWAAAGAVIGGAVMYAWGAGSNDGVERVLVAVPAIDAEMVGSVREELEVHGVWAVFLGPIRTTPYKIYAALAPAAGVAVAPLLVVTVPARLVRFVIAAWVAGWLLPRMTPRWPPLRRTWLVAIFWIVNYALYWSLQGTG